MKYAGLIMGLLFAVALFAAGFFLLPSPGLDSEAGIFTLLWLLLALAAVISFGKAASRQERLNRYRSASRGARRFALHGAPRQKSVKIPGELLVRERERRLD